MLEHFYAEVNNKKGEDYEPESLKVMMASLDRHLKNKGCTLSIVRGPEFSSSKEVLEDKAKQLATQGKKIILNTHWKRDISYHERLSRLNLLPLTY